MKTLESKSETLAPDFSHVAETCLLTFYCHAIDNRLPDPILKDEVAVSLTRRITPMLAASDSRLLRALSRGRISPALVVHITLRARHYDDIAREFITRHPDGVIVNLGCGMDSRFNRIDNGRLSFFDLDLPEVIEFRRQFYQEEKRYRMLAYSVFDLRWLEEVRKAGKHPVLFLAEGLFMYLEADKVKALVLELKAHFPGAELACEVVNSRWLSPFMKTMLHAKLRQGNRIGADADFHFGLSDGREMETWQEGIHFLDEWCYLETGHPRLGFMRLFRKNKLFLRTQWTVHYQLG